MTESPPGSSYDTALQHLGAVPVVWHDPPRGHGSASLENLRSSVLALFATCPPVPRTLLQAHYADAATVLDTEEAVRFEVISPAEEHPTCSRSYGTLIPAKTPLVVATAIPTAALQHYAGIKSAIGARYERAVACILAYGSVPEDDFECPHDVFVTASLTMAQAEFLPFIAARVVEHAYSIVNSTAHNDDKTLRTTLSLPGEVLDEGPVSGRRETTARHCMLRQIRRRVDALLSVGAARNATEMLDSLFKAKVSGERAMPLLTDAFKTKPSGTPAPGSPLTHPIAGSILESAATIRLLNCAPMLWTRDEGAAVDRLMCEVSHALEVTIQRDAVQEAWEANRDSVEDNFIALCRLLPTTTPASEGSSESTPHATAVRILHQVSVYARRRHAAALRNVRNFTSINSRSPTPEEVDHAAEQLERILTCIVGHTASVDQAISSPSAADTSTAAPSLVMDDVSGATPTATSFGSIGRGAGAGGGILQHLRSKLVGMPTLVAAYRAFHRVVVDEIDLLLDTARSFYGSNPSAAVIGYPTATVLEIDVSVRRARLMAVAGRPAEVGALRNALLDHPRTDKAQLRRMFSGLWLSAHCQRKAMNAAYVEVFALLGAASVVVKRVSPTTARILRAAVRDDWQSCVRHTQRAGTIAASVAGSTAGSGGNGAGSGSGTQQQQTGPSVDTSGEGMLLIRRPPAAIGFALCASALRLSLAGGSSYSEPLPTAQQAQHRLIQSYAHLVTNNAAPGMLAGTLAVSGNPRGTLSVRVCAPGEGGQHSAVPLVTPRMPARTPRTARGKSPSQTPPQGPQTPQQTIAPTISGGAPTTTTSESALFLRGAHVDPLPPHLQPCVAKVDGMFSSGAPFSVLEIDGRPVPFPQPLWATGALCTVRMILANPLMDVTVRLQDVVPIVVDSTTGEPIRCTSYAVGCKLLPNTLSRELILQLRPHVGGALRVAGVRCMWNGAAVSMVLPEARRPMVFAIDGAPSCDISFVDDCDPHVTVFPGQPRDLYLRLMNTGQHTIRQVTVTAHRPQCHLDECAGCACQQQEHQGRLGGGATAAAAPPSTAPAGGQAAVGGSAAMNPAAMVQCEAFAFDGPIAPCAVGVIRLRCTAPEPAFSGGEPPLTSIVVRVVYGDKPPPRREARNELGEVTRTKSVEDRFVAYRARRAVLRFDARPARGLRPLGHAILGGGKVALRVANDNPRHRVLITSTSPSIVAEESTTNVEPQGGTAVLAFRVGDISAENPETTVDWELAGLPNAAGECLYSFRAAMASLKASECLDAFSLTLSEALPEGEEKESEGPDPQVPRRGTKPAASTGRILPADWAWESSTPRSGLFVPVGVPIPLLLRLHVVGRGGREIQLRCSTALGDVVLSGRLGCTVTPPGDRAFEASIPLTLTCFVPGDVTLDLEIREAAMVWQPKVRMVATEFGQ